MKLFLRRDPDHDEARWLREYAGLSREELAERLCVSPLEVSAWEAGTIAVPPAHAERLRYEADAAWYERALRAAGVPPCTWWEEHQARLQASGYEHFVHGMMVMSDGARHEARCPACIARKQFGRGEPPPRRPTEQWGALGRWLRAIRLPGPRRWHPLLNQAASGAAMAMWMVVVYAAVGDGANDARWLAGAWAVSMLLEIGVKLGFRAVAKRWRDWPVLSAFVAVVITMLPAALLMALMSEDFGSRGVAFCTLLPATVLALLAARATYRMVPETPVPAPKVAVPERLCMYVLRDRPQRP